MIKLSSQFNLTPGDRLIHPIAGYFGAKHHGIFLSEDRFGNELVSENHKQKGVQVVTADSYIAEYGQIERIVPFNGTEAERYNAIKRALSDAGKPYDLIANNCEHHANHVQNGVSESKQVQNVFLGLLGFIVIAALVE
ncbi:MAG: hypothetical protein JST50_06830 [Bacteroidetes bacterium]|jgi:hypothetical protein|nr:hypothetical protein [Bacteroidota bacterium]